MKKVFSIILVFVLILLGEILPVSAKNITPNETNLFEDKFVSRYGNMFDDNYVYYEFYTHYNELDEVEWVLMNASSLCGSDFYIKEVIGDWVLYSDFDYSPFSFNYGIYDSKNDTFVKLTQECLDIYEGLDLQMHHIRNANLIGDVDGDKELSVLDATNIQRAIAELCEFDSNDDLTSYFDYGGNLNYISDFNRDGERSVLDATAIQMKLAKVES